MAHMDHVCSGPCRALFCPPLMPRAPAQDQAGLELLFLQEDALVCGGCSSWSCGSSTPSPWGLQRCTMWDPEGPGQA